MKIDIIRIGNSKGIRLPKTILEQCGIGDEVELEVRGKEVVLRPPKRRPREGWAEAFEKAIEKHGSPGAEMLLGAFPNAFDAAEWTWPETADDR